MGIKGVGQAFIDRHSLVSNVTNLNGLLEIAGGCPVYVDLFGSFFSLLPKARSHEDFIASARRIRKLLPPADNITLVLDGKISLEKELEHHKRANNRKEAMLRWGKKLDALEADPKMKISKSKWRKMKKLKDKSFKLSATDKRILHDELIQTGFNVVIADGEADVHIAKSSLPFIAVSGDSDFLFHRNINCCARPKLIRGCLSFHILERGVVMARLEISEPQLLALAIVSGNDYSQNIKGFSVGRNLAMVKSITSTSVYEIVETYINQVKSSSLANFDAALKIFEDLDETQLLEDGETWVHEWDKLLLQYKYLQKAHIRDNDVKPLILSNRSILHMHYKQPNPFRPIHLLQNYPCLLLNTATNKDNPTINVRYQYKEVVVIKKPFTANPETIKVTKKNLNKPSVPKKRKLTDKDSKKQETNKLGSKSLKSTRKAREDILLTEEQKEASKCRIVKHLNHTKEYAMMMSMKKKFALKTIEIGCLKRRIRFTAAT